MDSDLQFISITLLFIVFVWIIANLYVRKWQERQLEKYLRHLRRERIKRERADGNIP